MLLHYGVNKCQEKRWWIHPDVERRNIWKTSEDTRDHLEIVADSEMDFHTQECYSWYHGAWAHPCPSLHLQVTVQPIKARKIICRIEKNERAVTLMTVLPSSST
jgi:hypothetical protein